MQKTGVFLEHYWLIYVQFLTVLHIIAKLEAYGFHIDALKLIHDYLSNRKQRVKVNDAYRSWMDVFYSEPQGSLLGLLLFNMHLEDLFYILVDLQIASYVDDATIYIVNKNKESVISALETSSLLFGQSKNNFMKANCDKSNLIMSSSNATTTIMILCPLILKKQKLSQEQKLTVN